MVVTEHAETIADAESLVDELRRRSEASSMNRVNPRMHEGVERLPSAVLKFSKRLCQSEQVWELFKVIKHSSCLWNIFCALLCFQ